MIANVTPTQLYGRLLGDPPDAVAAAGRRFRYGRAEMQIHFALSEPPRWEGDERLAQTAVVHVTPGLDGVSRAVNEAERGLLPAEPTIVCGQPLTIDPSRAPDGKGMLWIQLQELPWHVKGDAAGELDTGDGTWTEELRERYADRIQARLARHIPNLESIDARAHDSLPRRPAGREPEPPPRRPVRRLARARPELPLAAVPAAARATGRRSTGLWHIGASTWPGPGLGAGSGTLVAQELLQPPARTRVLRRLPRFGSLLAVARGRERCGKIRASVAGRWRSASIRRGRIHRRRSRIAVARSAPRFSISQISTFAASFDGRPRRLRRRRARRDRHLGAEAAGGRRRRRRARGIRAERSRVRVGGAARAVDPAAAAARRADRSGRAHRRALRLDPPARAPSARAGSSA